MGLTDMRVKSGVGLVQVAPSASKLLHFSTHAYGNECFRVLNFLYLLNVNGRPINKGNTDKTLYFKNGWTASYIHLF